MEYLGTPMINFDDFPFVVTIETSSDNAFLK